MIRRQPPNGSPGISQEAKKRRRRKRRRAEKKQSSRYEQAGNNPSVRGQLRAVRVQRQMKNLPLVDHLRDAGDHYELPVKRRDKSPHSGEITAVKALTRIPRKFKLKFYMKLGIYYSNELCMVMTSNRSAAFNKAAKIFGIDPRKDKHWASMLNAIISVGLNHRDFRSVMRIRDLKVRGLNSAYRKAVINFIAKLPRDRVEVAFQWWNG